VCNIVVSAYATVGIDLLLEWAQQHPQEPLDLAVQAAEDLLRENLEQALDRALQGHLPADQHQYIDPVVAYYSEQLLTQYREQAPIAVTNYRRTQRNNTRAARRAAAP
jgi:hypothetical protein